MYKKKFFHAVEGHRNVGDTDITLEVPLAIQISIAIADDFGELLEYVTQGRLGRLDSSSPDGHRFLELIGKSKNTAYTFAHEAMACFKEGKTEWVNHCASERYASSNPFLRNSGGGWINVYN